jgi:hypothetical protein
VDADGNQPMSGRFEKRAAWIIEWELDKPDLLICDLRPHILPWRWESRKVFTYMRCLFWNSALRMPFETLEGVNSSKPRVWILNEGPRLMYGDATAHLMAWRVKDLRITEDRSGKCLIEWTAPAGIGIDHKTHRAVQRSAPIKRHYWVPLRTKMAC